jgi:hypothetical protein
MGEDHDPFMALVGGILCLVALAAYCAYQVQLTHMIWIVTILEKQRTNCNEHICSKLEQHGVS